MKTNATTRTLSIAGTELTVTEWGAGRPILLLHGGAGPQSIAGFAELLATTEAARVIAPTHPGFGGTHRPETLTTIAGLAELYAGLLTELDLRDVTLVGNSIGGWIAAEMALRDASRIGGIVLVSAVGIEVAGHPVADVFALTLDELMQLSYHAPAAFRVNPAQLSDAQRAVFAGNRAALAVYAGSRSSVDPTLRGRLGGIEVPALVLWGESDRVVDPAYGRAYADAIPRARFQLLPATGHVPQIETPAQLLAPIWQFASSPAA